MTSARTLTTRSAAIAALAVLALSACASEKPHERFDNAVEDGATCAELFEIRNELDPGTVGVERANETLREIGCYSSSSTRTDT